MSEVIFKDIAKSKTEEYIYALDEILATSTNESLKEEIKNTQLACNRLIEKCDNTIESKEVIQESAPYWGIEKTENFTKITCDLKIPHKTMDKRAYASYRLSIEECIKKHFVKDKHIKKCFMVFIHYHKYRQCKDADNFEEKPLSDMIADYFIIGGDGYDNVQRMTLTKLSTHNYTEVYLVPFHGFIKWYESMDFDL